MKGSPASPLAGCLLPLLLLVSEGVSGEASQFSVMGPAEPVMALLGTDATLPCQLSPEQSAAHMDIRWYRPRLTPAALVFSNGQEQGEQQMPEYRGRTRMVRNAIDSGRVALQIQQVQASDDGQYHCRFSHGSTARACGLCLLSSGLGSAPLVHMTGPEKSGIRVLCASGGWFPAPKVQWRDTKGKALPSSSESLTQDAAGLFHVEATLLVTDRDVGSVVCSIQNPLSEQEEVKGILLPEPFFPRPSPWRVALALSFSILSVLLGGISFATWKEHQVKRRELEKRAEESAEVDLARKEMEAALKGRDDLQADLDRRKALYREDWKKALLYPDWRKELFQQAPVKINHEAPGQEENGGEETQDPSVCSTQVAGNLITLCLEGFMLGRYHWEGDSGDAGDAGDWTLGIYELRPQGSSPKEWLRKFRVLEKGDRYRALAFWSQYVSQEQPLRLEARPRKIAVFLDQEDNDLSFYNVTEQTHMFSFTQASFLGSLYPYFKRNSLEPSPSAQP
ncbi:butyrophilin-like protein 1 [Meriones unguiculatus]|uniref:butyrophilin-like protein 1 n=1 Tax=Meriones unguiculatus TaxID=10047 RepID=UPI000B4FD3E3|nr:butyrophilin-like protein 1 [Meriones unguiculatus]